MQANDNRKGVRYLRPGMLAAPTTVELTAAPKPGNFAGKMDLAFKLEGQPFVLSISENHPDYVALGAAFGLDGDSWVGRRVRLQDGKVLKGVRVEPAQ